MGLMHGFEEIFKSKKSIAHRETHQSIDLNELVLNPSVSELGDPSEIPFSREKKLVTEFREELSMKMRSLSGPGPRQINSCANLDLSLRLSPPMPSPADLLVSGGSMFLLTTHLRASLGLDGEELSDLGIPKIPAMILKGCRHCHMFAMVSKINLRCPNCGGRGLIGDFSEGPTKRMRMN